MINDMFQLCRGSYQSEEDAIHLEKLDYQPYDSYSFTTARFSQHVSMCLLLIDKGFCEAEMSSLLRIKLFECIYLLYEA